MKHYPTDDFLLLTAGYDAVSLTVTYADVAQRWLVVRSQAAHQRARATTQRQLLKASEAERKRFDTLCRQHFSCEQDARQALARYQQSCRVLTVSEVSVSTQQHYRKAGRPAKETLPERVSYYFHGMPSAPVSLFEAHVERAQRPNAKWMFELFLDVHPLFITTQDVQVLVMNLKDELRQLLTLLEPPYIEAYS